jgi:hypothetical protein
VLLVLWRTCFPDSSSASQPYRSIRANLKPTCSPMFHCDDGREHCLQWQTNWIPPSRHMAPAAMSLVFPEHETNGKDSSASHVDVVRPTCGAQLHALVTVWSLRWREPTDNTSDIACNSAIAVTDDICLIALSGVDGPCQVTRRRWLAMAGCQ